MWVSVVLSLPKQLSHFVQRGGLTAGERFGQLSTPVQWLQALTYQLLLLFAIHTSYFN